MTTLHTETPTLTVRHANIVFDTERVHFTFAAVQYADGWQCYMASGIHEAETAVRIGVLLPVKAGRVVFPDRRGQPYLYSDRREKLP